MLGKWRNHMRNCIYVVMGGFVLFRKRHCSGVFITNFEQVNVSWGSTRRVHDNLNKRHPTKSIIRYGARTSICDFFHPSVSPSRTISQEP